MKQKRTKRLKKIHETQALTMWRDDFASLAFIYDTQFEGAAMIFHNNYGLLFCVGSNWEPT
jgi:hypothetical protein